MNNKAFKALTSNFDEGLKNYAKRFETHHFIIVCRSGKNELSPFWHPDFYTTEAEIKLIAQGIRIGMACKYARPSVLVYKVTEEGEKVLFDRYA